MNHLMHPGPGLLLLLGVLLTAACSRPPAPPEPSPSARFTVRTEISGDEAGPTRRLCVKLVVFEVASEDVHVFQTGASDTQKWALGWTPDDSLVLYSSDIGTRAYDITGGQIVERPPGAQEEEIAREAYERKYGGPSRSR